MSKVRSILCGVVLCASVLSLVTPASAGVAKNIFLMVSDGAGFNYFNAGSMYQYGPIGSLPYEQDGWTKYAVTTYPLRFGREPNGLGQDPDLVYDAAQAWDTTPEAVEVDRAPAFGLASNSAGAFAGYNFVKTTYTDSAAAGSAIASGVRTYRNSINTSNSPAATGTPLSDKTIAEIAKANGRATGIVSSGHFSHATPATIGGAHNISRRNMNEIANEMLDSGTLDLIFSAGHPAYDDNGQPLAEITEDDADKIGGLGTFEEIISGTHAGGWSLIEHRTEFQNLADGTTSPRQGRLIGLAQVDNALQYNRAITQDWNGNGVVDANPFFPRTADERSERQMAPVNPGDDSLGDPYNSNVPTLATMTKAAINQLYAQADSDGMFLMVEGSHVDSAGHGHNTTRLIEEQVDFNNSVEAVMDWIEVNDPDYSESLVLVLADHETGMVWGPNSDTIAFDPIVDNGVGETPGMIMNSTQHTNQLVPVYARGVGVDRFADLTDGVDDQYLERYGMSELAGWGNEYIDITDIYAVMAAVVPEPTTAILGDFNGNEVLDADDINRLSAEILAGTNASLFDLNDDAVVNELDRDVWVHDVVSTFYGDANLDGMFDSDDLIEVFSAGKYTTGGMAGWAEGDVDGDQDFDSDDLIQALADGGYNQGPREAVNAVPEPATFSLLVAALILVACGQRMSRKSVGWSVVSVRPNP